MRAVDAARSIGGRSHNVPHLPSSFVGRRRELAEVADRLNTARLVTLTGPGGMGKTRLAIQLASATTGAYPGGVWLVELASLGDPTLVEVAVAEALPGGARRPGRCSAEEVAAEIGQTRMLLILDNCEHLVVACGELVDILLRTCPGLRVLATSREPLRVDGEHLWSVGPLSLPAPKAPDAASVEESEAGELFVRRAVAASPDFRLTDRVAPTVAEICRRLDGMPLAIELAAARLASLAPTDILDRLDDRFKLLTTGNRTAQARHQTLAATLEWSHDQLSPAEAAVLRRAAVFATWTLDAAQDVCAWGDVARKDVVDHIAALVSKSLVMVERQDNRVRYCMLETIRAWAREKLVDAGEADAAARRHAAWCLELAELAQAEVSGRRPQMLLDGLDREHDNFRAALEWARATEAFDIGVGLVNALTTFWRTRGHLAEGLAWLEWAAPASAASSPIVRATVLRGAGLFRGMLGDMAGALPLLDESSAVFTEAGDHDASVCACQSMFHMLKNPRQSLPGLERDIDRCRRTSDANKLAHFIWALGQAHFLLGEPVAARRQFQDAVELGRSQPDGEAMRSALFGLGRVAALLGEPDAAESAFTEAGALAEKRADVDHQATALVLLGDLARSRGAWDEARRLLGEARNLTNADGSSVDEARALYFAARLAEAEAAPGAGDNGAGELFAEALVLARHAGGLGFHEVRCLLGLGWSAEVNGEHSGSIGHLLEGLATAQAIGDDQAAAHALELLSRAARSDARHDEALTLARRALDLYHRIGDVAGVASSLESLAGSAADGERWSMAAPLLAAAQVRLDAAGYARSRSEQARYEEALGRVRAALDETTFAAAVEEGSSWSVDEAVSYALRKRGNRDRPVTGWHSLTPAEREVAQLVGEGLTNPEVGRRLFISPRTVGHHLAHVYQKLGIHARGALIKELAGRAGDLN